MSRVYLDYNATTPLAPEVASAVIDGLSLWHNPSSAYGATAKQAIDKARDQVKAMINAESAEEVTFTSGGTEANNWVIDSTVRRCFGQQPYGGCPHIITTAIEHPSVSEPLKRLASARLVAVDFVAVANSGAVEVEQIIDLVKPETCLVTLMMANNETGVLQPLEEVGRRLAEVNKHRQSVSLPKVLLHSDAAQAIGKVPVDVQRLDVDFLTIVGHKFYGPRIGAVFHRKSAPLDPIFVGGGQQLGLRAGTENTPMIVGLGQAAELVTQHLSEYSQHFATLQSHLERRLDQAFGDQALVNFSHSQRLPNTTSLALVESVSAVAVLSHSPQLLSSVGSACHSTAAQSKPSPVLVASGVDPKLAIRTIRLSTGRETTAEDIDFAVDSLMKSVASWIEPDSGDRKENSEQL